jgi:hypothetical protein
MQRAIATEAIWSVNHTADQVIENVYVKGMGTNVTCQKHKGDLTIRNVVSVDSWRADQFGGQGVYIDDVAGDVLIEDCLFAYNGRPRPPMPAQIPTPFRHGVYVNSNVGKLTVKGCIFAQSASAGLQSRSLKGSTVTGCVFLDAAIAILLIEGGATVTGNLIYGGQYAYDGFGLTENMGLRSYWPALLQNNYFVTRPGQSLAPAIASHPEARAFPQGGVCMGGEWVHNDPPWTPPPTSPDEFLLPGSAANWISQDWPGFIFAGKTRFTAFSLLSGPIAFDYRPVIAAIEAGGDVATGIAACRAALLPKPATGH